MLVRAAANEWNVAPGDVTMADGVLHHAASGRSLPYSALIEVASKLTPAEKPKPKARANWSVLGKSVPRYDTPSKVDGSAVFGIDKTLPGMLTACVIHPPRFGSRLASLDKGPALRQKGVVAVVDLPRGVAVVADRYWHALKGAKALRPQWTEAPLIDSDKVRAEMLAAVARGDGEPTPAMYDPRLDRAKTEAALAQAAKVIDLTYDVPYLAHATMEVMNALAVVEPDRAELWLSTQSPLDTQKGVARALGLRQEQVVIHPERAGGGFGRRLEHAFAIEAALIARAMRKPVKMIWSRETDMQAGGYRPAGAARVRISLGADGMPTCLRADLANPNLLEHTRIGMPPDKTDWTASMGWVRHRYAIPALYTNWTRVDPGVPCGFWRSVGASQNVFFFETALDHAARAAGIDPVEYRRRLFAKDKLRLAFLDALAARAGWAEPLPEGRFRGIAISQGNSAVSGHVVELSLTGPNSFRMHRITAAVDAGIVGNPNIVEAQIMGGTLFGLAAALFSEITLRDGRVEQSNFDGYQVARMADVPPIDCLVMGSGASLEGVGEEGVASIAPAIANALLSATGQAVTRLPLSRAGWRHET
jgi:isoquinoline 1-oxidoreductase beta subunit